MEGSRMKNGRTMGQDIRIVRRGLKEFERILPGQMRRVRVRSILIALIPFVTAAISATIIEKLVTGSDRSVIVAACLTGVGLLFLLAIWKGYEDCKIAIGYNRLFSSHEITLTNRAYSLPYEVLERSSTRQLRDEVSGSINLSGAGMASLYWDMDVLWTNLVTAAIAISIFVRFIYQMLALNKVQNTGYVNTIGMLLLIAAMVFGCSYISCKMTSKRFDVSFELFQNGSKYSRYGDFYTMNYLQDENAAMDTRIYQQENLILSESRSRCYEHLAAGKEKEFNAVNRFDGIKVVSSCICGCVVYLLIGQRVLQQSIGCGSIILMYTATTMCIEALARIAEIVTDLRNNNEHLLRYFKYMDLPTEETKGEKESSDKGCAKIVFQNVSFRYPESQEYVLKNINLEIKGKEKLAIVGENGSGKTTLIKLLCRLYQPTEGKILLNGKDIREYSYEDYIERIASVFQDFSLFAFSLAENVAATSSYDRARVLAALQQAGLADKVRRLGRGIEQPLFHDFDEEGTDLSGGEAQKAAIARAIYKDADIMILDEPTAALDPYAEYEIYKRFGELAGDKTLLSISHRLSSCRMCDRIVVLHQGEIAQCGSHQELLAQTDGKYYELWNMQAQYYT